MLLRYIVYCRKSTDSEDRQVQSIEDQQREVDHEIKRRKLTIIKTFGESKSAKKPGRPMFDEMMGMLKRGEADGIICWKLNRLARNPVDGGEIQWLLQQNIIKSIITPGREYLPSDNVLMMAVELGMANQFILDLSKDVTRGMRTKVEKGWRPGRAVIGYLNDKYGDKGNKIIHKDLERFPLVRKMWDLLLTENYSVSHIMRVATDEWGLRTREGKTLSTHGAFKIFTNQFYYGDFGYKGEVYQGKHEPMITKEEFDRAQVILGKNGKPRPKDKRLPFNGVIRCAKCGGMVVAEEKFKRNKTKGTSKRYLYHHCSHNRRGVDCRQKSIIYEDVVKKIHDYLDEITIPPEFLRVALEVLREQNSVEEYDRTLILKNQQEAYTQCLKKIDNLIGLYISPDNGQKDLLTEQEFREQKNALMTEKTRVEGEMQKLGTRVNDWIELTEKTFHFATYAKYWFDSGDYETKTHILRALGQNFYFLDKRFTIVLKNPYLVLKEGLENETLKNARVEPTILGEDKRKNSHTEAVFSAWSR